MIEKHKKENGWEFLFLGANIDAVETARHFGISEDRAVTYCADAVGTRTNFEAVSETVRCVRTSEPINANWKNTIEEHLKKK